MTSGGGGMLGRWKERRKSDAGKTRRSFVGVEVEEEMVRGGN